MQNMLGRLFKGAIISIFLLSILIGCYSSAIKYVNADEAKTIRVGFCKIEGFMSYEDLGSTDNLSYDDNGNYDGYYVDYLRRIAQITGWNYVYVELDNMEQGYTMLANHEIDLLAPCQLETELMDAYDYSQYSFGTEYYALVTGKDNMDIYYEDYEGMDGRVIGALAPLETSQSLNDYMSENDFICSIKYYETVSQLKEALTNGDIDLIWMSQMMSDESEKIVARFSPYPFYFMTWKGNDETLSTLDNAMQNLKNTYPGLENELLTTYFPLYNILYFTREEQEFIDSLQPIKVAYVSGNTPISFQNSSGELDGISREVFDKIQEVSGLQFEYEMLPEGDITYDYLREQCFDLITGVRYNKSNLYSRGILISNPYLSSKMMLVGNDDEEFDIGDSYTVAVVSGSQTLTNEIVSNFPNFTVVSYDTIEECFESVRKGKNDFLMADRYIVNYWLTRPIYNDLYILPVDGLSDELCFSAVVDIYGINTMSGLNGVELVSIINKALSQISEDEIEEIIINENNAHAYGYTLDDFLYSYRYATLIGIIAIIVAVILYINTEKLKNKARKIQENESKRIALQNKRYQMMMDSSGEMLYDINIMGESGFISEQIKLKFGWSMPERVTDFTACRLREIFHIHPDDWRREHKKIKNSLDNNIPCKCLVRIMPSEGDDIWCKIYFFPLLNDEKKLVSIIGKIEDVDKDTKEKDKLKHESETDFMTGLMNKLTFEARTVKLMTKKNVYNSALLFVDLDHFKAVNDLLGHSIGDEVIKETATKLQKLFANVDLVSRFGGDEFCVFVWNIPMSKLIDKLERLLSIMNKTYSNGEVCVDITASIGVVYCKKEDVDYKTMLNIADEALYEAKDIGRNRYVIKEL